MAGTIKTPTRKQWNLNDRSLYKLRYQLAEDGCVDSQVQIAKQLLEDECDIRAIREANNRQAVHWLLRAAEQGSEEATELLNNCHHEGCGVTEDNANEIKTCLNLTQYEKLARKTSRDIYSSLSKDSDYVTLAQLRSHIIEIYNIQRGTNNQKQHNSPSSCDKVCYKETSRKQSIHVTESSLLSAAVSFANGVVPAIFQSLPISTLHYTLEMDLPFSDIKFSSHFCLHFLCNKFLQLANASLSIFFNIHLHLFFLFYFLVYSGHALLIIPSVLYYLSFAVMTISTFRMFEVYQGYTDFAYWSELFHYHSDGILNSDQAEYNYLRRHSHVFKTFFIALLAHLSLHSVVSEHWISHSEFAIISYCLSLATLIAFSSGNSQNIRFRVASFCSYVLNVFAKFPYKQDSFMNKSWPLLNTEVHNLTSYLFGNKIEFYMNGKAFLYTIIPGILLFMAKAKNWQGFYRFCLPQCITLSWFQLFIMNVEGVSMNGLVRVISLFFLLIFFVPISNLASIVLPVIALDHWFCIESMEIRVAVIIGILCCAIYLSMYPAFNVYYGKYVTAAKMLFGLIAILYLTFKFIGIPYDGTAKVGSTLANNVYNTDNVNNADVEFLTWNEYQYTCLDKTNSVSSQMDCLHLNGLHVKWTGYVTNVKLVRVQNILTEFLDSFPDYISSHLKCFFGQINTLYCDNEECMSINKKIKKANLCDLKNWNRYEYEISLNLQSGILTAGPIVTLRAGHDFYNFTRILRANDKIEFKGVLITNPLKKSASELTAVNLEELSCLNCHKIKQYVSLSKVIHSSESIVHYILISLRNVLNFISNPLFIFKEI